jgi:dihydroorotate dehydrogenase (fumarate)
MGALMDLSTSYLGLKLSHPFMAGASPMARHLDGVRRLEDAGCAAVVLHSVFEEQISQSRTGRVWHMDPEDPHFAETLSHFPSPADYAMSPDAYATYIQQVKAAVSIPVIASMNGSSAESWLRFSKVVEQAGADALELNLYEVVTDLSTPAIAVERQLTGIVSDVKRILKIPVAVKVSPFFSAFGNMARQLDEAGADGLVIFNRFYQPDIDIKSNTVVSRAELSTSAELLLRLRWIAILHGRVRPSLALTGGVETSSDGIKAVLAGADVVQMVSALLRHGPDYITAMRRGLEQWMEWNKVETLGEMRGRLSMQSTGDPSAFERAHYIKALHSWTR